MKKITISGCLMVIQLTAFAGVAGRKGVSDDQLLAFTVSLICLLLLIGFSKNIVAFIKQQWGKFHH
ncbi:MAG: hypothetical protein V4590_06200 [Bacteroidota bacterium]